MHKRSQVTNFFKVLNILKKKKTLCTGSVLFCSVHSSTSCDVHNTPPTPKELDRIIEEFFFKCFAHVCGERGEERKGCDERTAMLKKKTLFLIVFWASDPGRCTV
jgi:hypothetical protein